MADLTTLLSKFLEQLYAGNVQASGDGTSALPAYAFASEPGLGWYRPGAGAMYAPAAKLVGVGGYGSGPSIVFGSASGILGAQLSSNAKLGWSSTTNEQSTADTGISRTAGATIAVGNGTVGDVSGTVNATIFKSGATAGVTTFGPAGATSFTVKGGIITAIS